MKYDVLDPFRDYLSKNCGKNTAKKYYSAVKNLFSDMDFNQLAQIDQKKLLEKMKKIKSKNEFSAAKNGLKWLKKFDGSLQLPAEHDFKELSLHKRNWVKSKGKQVNYDTMRRKVNAGTNKKIKLACRVAAISGLRVSELGALRPEDITLKEDGTISIFVERGKGGKPGTVDCMKDDYVYEQLKTYCTGLDPGTKLFYSEGYMREIANKNGMQMHDFRRVFAVKQKVQLISEGYTAPEANHIVKEKLRHARFSTTKRYLYGRKIQLYGEKKKQPKIKQKIKRISDYGYTDTRDSQGNDSLSKFTDSTSSLLAERELLHKQIINKFFSGVRPSVGAATFTVMGGGPASGKSTMLQAEQSEILNQSLTIDSDGIKGELPEYQEMIKNNNSNAANYVHEESSALAKRILKIALQDNYNVILDGTGDGSIKSLMSKIQQAKAAGVKVNGIYATCPVDIAIERATQRAAKTGRMVPEDSIRKIHSAVSRILPVCAKEFDTLKVYDTTEDLILIATGGSGEPLQAVAGQEVLFNQFIQKGGS